MRIEKSKRRASIEMKKPGLPELRLVLQGFKPQRDALENLESNPGFALMVDYTILSKFEKIDIIVTKITLLALTTTIMKTMSAKMIKVILSSDLLWMQEFLIME